MNTATVLTVFVATVILAALFLAPMYWPFGFALWIVVVTALLLVVVRWHVANTVYRCPECGKLFSISAVSDLVSPHGLGRGGGWKLLTCPKCGKYVRAQASMKDNADTRP